MQHNQTEIPKTENKGLPCKKCKAALCYTKPVTGR